MPGRVASFTIPMIVTWLLFASVPLWIERVGLYQYLGVEILIFALYALAYNLVLGHAGLPSFGHGAFFGIGAYAFGLAQFKLIPNLWLCLGVAVVAAALAGAIVALFISHRRGIYYALMTIAFGQIFWFVTIKWHGVTGGEDGLLKIARLPVTLGFTSFDLSSNAALYYFVLAAFVVVMTLVGGGLVSFWGPVIGAVAFFLTRDIVGALTTGWMLWFGLSFVILVLFKPEGIAGLFGSWGGVKTKSNVGVAAPLPRV